jgi:hypothetical protein
MDLKTARDLLGFLLECKEGNTAEYLNANEQAFKEAVGVAVGCINKQLQLQRVVNDAMFKFVMLLHEE